MAKSSTITGVILFFLFWTAEGFLGKEEERVGSAKEQLSKIEKGLERSKIRAVIFSKIAKATSNGRVRREQSEFWTPNEEEFSPVHKQRVVANQVIPILLRVESEYEVPLLYQVDDARSGKTPR
ncbi:hypothetical protein MRB53_009006 [Persea americana]|uniref:Uncharacterized protein n=1 Tax=Persea americana TaxID=3435 RepID=A0ACC2LNV9_PERAE|nr:hypothetical protein MRB53_009006 [Persea americana]